MEVENKLENLSFESIDSVKSSDLNEKNKPSGNKFAYLLTVLLFILFIFIIILGYFLFFNNQIQSNTGLIEKVEKSDRVKSFDFSTLNERFDYQISIYLSIPSKELEYLGEGVLIEGGVVLTSSEVVKDYKSENIVIRQKDKNYFLSRMEGHVLPGDSKLWFLFVKDSKLSGSINFVNKDLKIGEEYFLRATRKEKYDENQYVSIETFYSLKVVGFDQGKSYYMTNYSSPDFGSPIYDVEGNIVGIVNSLDSRNNIKINAGVSLENSIKSSLSTGIKNNKETLGIEFEFSNLEKFKKEGGPVGLIVKSVDEDSIASKAGIKKGDVVLTMNNQILTSESELEKFFNNLNVREEVKLEIVREDKKLGVTLSLGQLD